jgi:hypothetical protein
LLSKYTRGLKSPIRGDQATPKRNFVVKSQDLFKISNKEQKEMKRNLNIATKDQLIKKSDDLLSYNKKLVKDVKTSIRENVRISVEDTIKMISPRDENPQE